MMDVLERAHAARAQISELEAKVAELGAAALTAANKFENDPSDKAATSKLVADQRHRNAVKALEAACAEHAELFAAEGRQLARDELARLYNAYEVAAFEQSVSPHMDAIIRCEREIRAAVAALVKATYEQRSASQRAAHLAQSIGAPCTVRAVDEHHCVIQLRERLVATNGPEQTVANWITYEPAPFVARRAS
jgi:hypothetical protein